jgi:hypothetical protein
MKSAVSAQRRAVRSATADVSSLLPEEDGVDVVTIDILVGGSPLVAVWTL